MVRNKILVVLLHGIGDCLMALPALHALKQQSPKSSLAVMTIGNPLYHDLLRYNKDIDQLLYSSLKKNPHYGNPLYWVKEYRQIKKDIAKAVKQHGFTKVYFVKMFLTPAKLHSLVPLKRFKEHKSLKVAKELGVTLKTKHYFMKYSIKDKVWATNYLKKHKLSSKKLLGLHFTGSAASKSLPYPVGKLLLHQLRLNGYDLLLFHDKHSYAREQEHYNKEDVTTYISDSILRTAALVDHCKALFCVDSGIAHIAAALRKKVFVIYFKSIWKFNSLAFGDKVEPFLYKRKGKRLLGKVRLFLK